MTREPLVQSLLDHLQHQTAAINTRALDASARRAAADTVSIHDTLDHIRFHLQEAIRTADAIREVRQILAK